MNHTSRQAHVRLAPSVLLLCGLLVAAGCTRVVTVTAPGDALHVSYGTQTETPAYWWDVGISIARAEDAQTLWHVDTLLADQLFRPIIKELGPRLKVWRFHRRARRDERGHLFRFFFYSDIATAELVNERVEAATLLSWLRDQKVVKRVSPVDTATPTRPGLGDRSDRGWPPEIKASWPYFAMGVSQSWLALIEQARAANPAAEPHSAENLLADYKNTNDQVTALWREQAQHAYLHHLSALFGYQPVLIRNNVLTRF